MFIPVTQKEMVWVENHRLPKFINLFRNSACVKAAMNMSELEEARPPLKFFPLLATTKKALKPIEETKKRGGKEL
eukprot:CAMPEP_0170565570 /NCGR_PEP_ID=MMETSP0211-20121228/79275_1 /TAXON_ID=311385 /ORGANISM="Pseudokeronopsis sp., Strain OXSARD2" /LENGTH=74 /DNA_ID=CAMNT_0010886483 /DNA_START=503 /DNA_END=727 /DNA_ORIENTATION=-